MRSAGYVSTKMDDSERLNVTSSYKALLEAKKVSLGDGTGTSNGYLLTGMAYIAMLDLQPVDTFKIMLAPVLVGGSDEEIWRSACSGRLTAVLLLEQVDWRVLLPMTATTAKAGRGDHPQGDVGLLTRR